MQRFRLRARHAIGALAVAALAFGGSAANAARSVPCEQLIAMEIPDATITAAQLVTSGTFVPPGSTSPIANLPPFCRVALTVAPQIKIEVWLPTNWNQRFQ